MNIDKERKESNQMFKDLMPIVNSVVQKYSTQIDKIVKEVKKIETLTNEDIRNKMLELSIECYFFGTNVAQSSLMSDCANVLYKESVAKEYSNAIGTQSERTSMSTIMSINKQVVNTLYRAVNELMKSKLDEAHRLVNTLNSVLISRSAEEKLNRRDIVNE